MKQKFCLCTIAAVLFLYQSSAFAEEVVDLDNSPIQTVSLEQIHLQDVVPGGQPVQLVHDGQQLGELLPTVNTQITRKIKWTAKVSSCSSLFEVNLDINNLNHTSQNDSQIKVDAKPVPEKQVCTPEPSNTGSSILEGEVDLTFDLSNIKASGSYSGNLIVDITEIAPP